MLCITSFPTLADIIQPQVEVKAGVDIDIIPLELPLVDAYMGYCPFGAGRRYVEIIECEHKRLRVNYLGNVYTVQTKDCTVLKMCRGIKLHVIDKHLHAIYPDTSWVNLGPCMELTYKISPEDAAYCEELVKIQPVKVQMNVYKISTIEEMKAICPPARRPSGDKIYVVVFDGDVCLAYTPEGTLIEFDACKEKIEIKCTSKLRTERNGIKFNVKNLTTGRSRLLGLSDSEENNGLIDIKAIKVALPANLNGADIPAKKADKVEVIIEPVIKTRSDKMSEVTTTTAAPVESTVKVETAVAKKPGRPAKVRKFSADIYAALANPVDPATGKPRKGRPPLGWKKTKADELVAAGRLTTEERDALLAEVEPAK